MKFYDAHAHAIKNQYGGILIGLEGEPYFENTLTNVDINQIVNNDNSRFLDCYYVKSDFDFVYNEKVLKYHPRREKYTSNQVINDLKRRNCKLCIIDTLNQPFWSYLDYWKIVSSFPDMLFILPHAGGYDVFDFLKILTFNKNVFMDFSLTQEYFGWCGDRNKLNPIIDSINYCLNSEKLHQKILFGSDEPFFSQKLAIEQYSKLKYSNDILINNFEKILTLID